MTKEGMWVLGVIMLPFIICGPDAQAPDFNQPVGLRGLTIQIDEGRIIVIMC